MRKIIISIFLYAWICHASVGLGWLGISRHITLEIKPGKSPVSFGLAGSVSRSESPRLQSVYRSDYYDNRYEDNTTSLSGSAQIYIIRNVLLFQGKKDRIQIKASPFIRFGYSYLKTKSVQNCIYSREEMNSYSISEELVHTGAAALGIRPEFVFFNKVSMLFYFGIAGSYNYRNLDLNHGVYNKDWSVDAFGDLFRNDGSNASVLSSISLIYWFGHTEDNKSKKGLLNRIRDVFVGKAR